jgi:hypothetical protein
MPMTTVSTPQPDALPQWVLVRAEPTGQYTARALGFSEISVTAPSKDDALRQVEVMLHDLLSASELVRIDVRPRGSLLQWSGRANPDDPNEKAYLDELARYRREDLARTLRELDDECSDTSSTPTM